VARSVHVRVLLLEFVSTFLLRLVSTLVWFVSTVCSLSALLLSSRILASLVSFGYLAFTQRHTLLGVCLLFLPLLCCLLSFVTYFLFVYGLLAHLEMAHWCYCFLPAYLRALLWALFICMFLLRAIVFQGWICAYTTRSG